MELKNNDDFGFVLTTDQIKTESWSPSIEKLETWFQTNKPIIESQLPKTFKSFGLFLVTKTVCTNKAVITIKEGRDRHTKLGVSAKVPAVGELGPKVEWGRTTNNNTWLKYEAEGDDWRVAFVQGAYFPHTVHIPFTKDTVCTP